jgi:very-short-patch-repair endonuclease
MFQCNVCKELGKIVEYEKASSLGIHVCKTHELSPQAYFDKYMAKPTDGKCAECGKPTKFRTIGYGYMEFCSKKCSAKHIAADTDRNAHKIAARQATVDQLNKDTHGEYNKKILETRKATMLERHGVEFYSQCDDFINKYHASNLAKYGKESYTQTDEYREKTLATNHLRYGADYWSKANLRISTDYYNREFAQYGCHVIEHPNKVDLTYKCDKCGSVLDDTVFFVNARLYAKNTPCSVCFPKRNFRSAGEVNIEKFIQSLGVDTSHKERHFLGEYGADIICENEKVIVEYDGLHWHTEEFHNKTYHLDKTNYAESLGYHLIHVFSDEWELHEEIVKSRLCRVLHKDIPRKTTKVYARDCKIITLDYEQSTKFMDKNHIQGACNDTYRYGLVHDGRMVAVMTFGPARYSPGEMEMLRFCNALYTTVVGGASRLLKHFLDDHPLDGKTLVTYADRRWSNFGNYYEKLGFVYDGTTEPNYYYVNGNIRESRMKYQKYKLVERGFDPNMSEHEIMKSLGIYRIYDCGNYRYVYKKEAKDAVEK